MEVSRRVAAERRAAVRALEREGLYVLEWTDTAGVTYPEHAHDDREVRIVLRGSMTVGSAARTVRLRAGDRLDLEPGEPHWARVGPDGVTYLAGTAQRPGP